MVTLDSKLRVAKKENPEKLDQNQTVQRKSKNPLAIVPTTKPALYDLSLMLITSMAAWEGQSKLRSWLTINHIDFAFH